MYHQDYRFRQGTRVRLKNTVDPMIYGDYGVTGNEGVVKDMRKDRFGLPEVLIHWDTNHWAYNGLQDCWTFEDHFELVKDTMASKKDKAGELAAMFAEGLARLFADEDGQEERDEQPQDLASRFMQGAQAFQGPQKPMRDQYTQALEAAVEKLAEGEAFIVVGVERGAYPGAPTGVLEPYALGFSKTPEAEAIVAAHMARVAANAHLNLAQQMVQLADDK